MRRPLGLSESQRQCETDQRLSRIIRNILASASLQPSSYLEATSDRITILEFDTEWSHSDIIPPHFINSAVAGATRIYLGQWM